jgi:hypothetical protein
MARALTIPETTQAFNQNRRGQLTHMSRVDAKPGCFTYPASTEAIPNISNRSPVKSPSVLRETLV